MWASVVVEACPVPDCTGCVLDAVEALSVNTLRLQRSDHTLNNTVLLWAVRRDKFLLQTVTANQCCVFPAGKNQTDIAAKQELLVDPSQSAEPVDQGVFERAGCRRGLAQSATAAIPEFRGCGSRSPRPKVLQPSRPDQTRHRSVDPLPGRRCLHHWEGAFIWSFGHRRHGLNPLLHADWEL
jgi:hypothetical protein